MFLFPAWAFSHSQGIVAEGSWETIKWENITQTWELPVVCFKQTYSLGEEWCLVSKNSF